MHQLRPFKEFGLVLDNVFEEMDSVFRSNGMSTSYPKVDIYTSESEIVFEAAVPGLEKEQISVSYANGYLEISGETASRDSKFNFHVKELKRSRFVRIFSLSQKFYDVNNIKAGLKNGILTIRVGRFSEKQVEQSKKIEISG